MRKALERVGMPIGVINNDAGNSVAISEQTGVEPGRDDKVVAGINVVQILIKRRENDRDLPSLQHLEKEEILSLVVGDNLDGEMFGKFLQNFEGELGLAWRTGMVHQPPAVRQLDGEADALDTSAGRDLFHLLDRQEGRAVQVNVGHARGWDERG